MGGLGNLLGKASKVFAKDASKVVAKDTSKVVAKDASKVVAKDAVKTTGRNILKKGLIIGAGVGAVGVTADALINPSNNPLSILTNNPITNGLKEVGNVINYIKDHWDWIVYIFIGLIIVFIFSKLKNVSDIMSWMTSPIRAIF